jgi:hypothetical protein
MFHALIWNCSGGKPVVATSGEVDGGEMRPRWASAPLAKFTENALDSMNFVNFARARGSHGPVCNDSATVWRIFRAPGLHALIFASHGKTIVALPQRGET